MRCVPQPGPRVGPEKPNPGSDGMTRWNAGASGSAGSVSGAITSRYSMTEPGQPWLSSSGVASSRGERTWRKWIRWPSMSVTNWG